MACDSRGVQKVPARRYTSKRSNAVRDRDGEFECWSAVAGLMRHPDKRGKERAAYERVLSLIGDDGAPDGLPADDPVKLQAFYGDITQLVLLNPKLA